MQNLQIFELNDELEPGHNAKASLLTWDGHEYSSRGAQSVIVHSFAGGHGLPGDRGYCVLGASNCWEVVGELAPHGAFG